MTSRSNRMRRCYESRCINTLVLNAACHGLGEIWVEIRDEAGRPVPGFLQTEAVSIDRNGTAQEVWWKQGSNVSALDRKSTRLNSSH